MLDLWNQPDVGGTGFLDLRTPVPRGMFDSLDAKDVTIHIKQTIANVQTFKPKIPKEASKQVCCINATHPLIVLFCEWTQKKGYRRPLLKKTI